MTIDILYRDGGNYRSVEATMSMEEFATAITGMARVPVELRVRDRAQVKDSNA